MDNILIAIIGETPQIFTEIIYYYLSKKYIFAKIIILTTEKGRQTFSDLIIKKSIIEKLCTALAINPDHLPFSKKDIFVFSDKGEKLRDIRTNDQINIATKSFYSILQKYTHNPNNKIIATIAGGRKNMSASLALGMQLFGRAHDELVHVLVSRKLENKNDWFYPQSKQEEKHLDVSQIPFLRVRNYMHGVDIDNLTPTDIFKLTQETLNFNAPIKKISVDKTKFTIDDVITFKMAPSQSLLLRFFINRKINHCSNPEYKNCNECTQCFLTPDEIVKPYSEFMKTDYPIIGQDGYISNRVILKYDAQQIRVTRSKTVKNLKNKIINPKYQKQFTILAISVEGDKRTKKYGLSVDKNVVKIIS